MHPESQSHCLLELGSNSTGAFVKIIFAPGGDQTHDLMLSRQLLYSSELLARFKYITGINGLSLSRKVQRTSRCAVVR